MPRVTVRDTELSFIRLQLTHLAPPAESASGAESSQLGIDLLLLRQLIADALQLNNGLIGSGIHIDVLSLDAAAETALVACATGDLAVVREALSSYTSKRYAVHCRVAAVAHHLSALT